MSFLSKLFGDSKEGKDALKFLETLLKEKEKEKAKQKENAAKNQEPQTTAPAPQPTYDDIDEDGPSGFSYGPRMPEEPNQYNYDGPYLQYFQSVYAEEFPALRQELIHKDDSWSYIINMYDGDRLALVAELLSRKSSAKKLKKDCKANGIPYVRFYYDYHGWWNTREYVVTRSREAMNG